MVCSQLPLFIRYVYQVRSLDMLMGSFYQVYRTQVYKIN